MLIKVTKGKIKSYLQSYTTNTNDWSTNKNCRSFRFTNGGDDPIMINSDGGSELLPVSASVSYGGYDDSYRYDNFSFEFAGIGLNPKLTISQDIEEEKAIYQYDFIIKDK